MNSRNTILGAASLIEAAPNRKVEHKSRGFLRELNSGGATPLEIRFWLTNYQLLGPIN
jgi:hypothetical protein